MTAIYEIGPFRLDTTARVLTYGDVPVALGPRGVDVLRVLLEHGHELVAKQDILDAAWPGVIVEESNLAVQISAIRRALAHAPGGGRWIETRARRGYRFVGPVAAVAGRSPGLRATDRKDGQGPSEWERRHLAFLRVRLVASPSVDAAAALMEVAETVRSFGGHVEDSSPTGLVAVFGLQAVDNAPSHAALAALAIQGSAAQTGTSTNRQVSAVITIDGEHCFVRRQGVRFEIARDGDATLGPFLDDLAGVDCPGTTLVAAAVVPFLTRRFELESLPDARRGDWMLLRRKAASADWTRFVGRSSEIATLREASALAARGRAQVVGIVGEAGVGKSRLVHEIVRQLQGWRVLGGGCAPYAIKTSYLPLAQMLRSLCGVQDPDHADEVRKKVAKAIPPEAGDPTWLLPALFDVLGVLPADDTFRAVDPALRRRRTHDALRQVFLAATAARPLCLIVEDLQWIDVASREVLDRLVNGVEQARLLLLVNYRPEFQHAWSHKSCYRQVRLDELPVENTGEMLDALFGVDAGLAPLKQQLASRGNPFFLEETVRALVETKTLDGTRGHYRLTRQVNELEVPLTVQAVLASRIARLAPEDRRLLQVASVVGKNAPLVLLQAVAELSEEPLRRGLEALEAAEFLDETGFHPDLAYNFKHVLTREVSYDSLPEDRRRALHARIVSAIEQAYPDRLTEHIERLAHHAVQGEMWEAAVVYLHQAGLKALERSAHREAADSFEQALAALEHCPERRETLERAIDLRFDLKTSLIPLGAFERIITHLRDAEAVVRRLDDPRRLGQFSVHMCQTLSMSGNPVEALAFGQNAEALADSLGDVSLQVTGTLFLGTASFSTLDYRRAEDLFLKVLRLLEGQRSRERFGLAGLPAVSARAYLTRIAGDQGRFERGILHGREGIRLAEAVDHPYSLATVYWCLADLHITKGEFEQAVGLLERGLAVAREWNLPFFAAGNAASLGYAHALLGRGNEGLPLLEQALGVFEAMGHRLGLSLFLVPLGEACALADRPDDALGYAERALSLARESGQRAGEANAHRLLGDVAARRDGSEQAQRHYSAALALAAELEMRPLAAHCHFGLGRLRRRTGQHEESRRHLAAATAMYRDMDMGYWLASAEGTLNRTTEDLDS